MKIRVATKKDLKRLIQLEMSIIDDMQTQLYRELGPERSEQLIFEASLRDPNGRYHHSRAIVAEEDGQIIGIAYGFPAEDETSVNLELDRLTEEKFKIKEKFFPNSEVYGDEWYLDSLVVDEHFRNRGVGTALLASSSEMAKKAGKKVIGLNVDDSNPKAKELYERVGFKEVNRVKIGPHNYTHMHRSLD
ncbi:GNAT family N-acetyltransferase [Xylocopilactobacillus apicola]|uniref:N-acetyltransferase n=1 Tax=Xylocopilactobacillus apicola TaxID=2932184 RepID=A0AAU9D9D3_9LACO|nr:GNAT family N-acetyltransferase [Xylocopilactobacillus apicola]BDR58090.1 N-acetyltransferase [Xylocopilactobacillus apicola]